MVKIFVKDFSKTIILKTVSPIVSRSITILESFGFTQLNEDEFLGKSTEKEIKQLEDYNFIISFKELENENKWIQLKILKKKFYM